VFDNYNLNKNVTGQSSGYTGFGMSSSNGNHFVTQTTDGKIFVFKEDWNYVSEKSSFTSVRYMFPVENFFYITGQSNVWKTDQELNILLQYNYSTTSPAYRGLFCNLANSLIYVVPYSLQEIHIFNLSLTLNDTISIAPYYPWSINGYDNRLYVGTSNGTMLVIVNKQIIQEFNSCNGQSNIVYSILFDIYYNMASSCSNRQLYLYDSNGRYLNKRITTLEYPLSIGYDTKSKLVIVSNTQIFLYS
jgi:hypothetical protein